MKISIYQSCIGACAALLMLAGVSAAQDAKIEPTAANDTMIVLDASGSMWGQIDGEAKISIAKTAVGDILEDWDNETGLGLIAYGHRRKGDCSDIETIVSVAKGTAPIVSAKVKVLNPKGKTPITASLAQAANALKYKENGATVILVSDGLETCNADPCALAKTLEADGVDFTAHIIGFGLNDEEFKSLQCIATETGGEYFTANSADELTKALETTVVATKKTGAMGLQTYASACEDCAPYKDVNFLWSAFALDDEDNKTGKAITSGSTQGYLAQIEPGRYYLEGHLDHNSKLKTGKIIEVTPDGVTKETLVIPAGRVTISAISNVDGPKIGSNMSYTFFGTEDENGKQLQYASSLYAADLVWLPVGDFSVTGRHGKAVASQSFSIIADEQTDVILDMKVGYLKVSARLSETSALLNGSNIWINRDEAGANFNNRIEFTTHKKVAQFILSEGDYIATSKTGKASGSGKASVIAGETTEITVTIGGGTVKMMAGYEEGQPIAGIDWYIHDNAGRKVANSTHFVTSRPTFVLNEGTYTATVNKDYKLAGSLKFEVKTGETESVFVIMDP